MRRILLLLVAVVATMSLYAQPKQTIVSVAVAPENTDWQYECGDDVTFSIDVKKAGAYNLRMRYMQDADEAPISECFMVVVSNVTRRITEPIVIKKTDGKFSELCHEIAKDYPDITVEDYYIDIMTANLLKEPLREKFQVILLPNLYGDIITDEAAEFQGGVGTAGSANLGDEYSMFEAIHGSAPRMMEEGRGMYANPTSMLKASEITRKHRADKSHRAPHSNRRKGDNRILATALQKCVCNRVRQGDCRHIKGNAQRI